MQERSQKSPLVQKSNEGINTDDKSREEGQIFWVIKGMSKDSWGIVLYMGDYIRGGSLPWHYLPVWMAISTPISYLLFFILGLVLYLWQLAKAPLGVFKDSRNNFYFLFVVCRTHCGHLPISFGGLRRLASVVFYLSCDGFDYSNGYWEFVPVVWPPVSRESPENILSGINGGAGTLFGQHGIWHD